MEEKMQEQIYTSAINEIEEASNLNQLITLINKHNRYFNYIIDKFYYWTPKPSAKDRKESKKSYNEQHRIPEGFGNPLFCWCLQPKKPSVGTVLRRIPYPILC